MRIVKTMVLGDKQEFKEGEVWRHARTDVKTAIEQVVWPEGASDFAICPIKNENGVVAIKTNCIASLRNSGWQVEQGFKIPGEVQAGPVDAQKRFGDDIILLEWETGNISSSHRALNKICIALRHGLASAGVLIVPDSTLGKFLTDRIGNMRELQPYLELWDAWAGEHGLLAIYVVAHDREDETVPAMPKNSDGNAKRYRERLKAMKEASGQPD